MAGEMKIDGFVRDMRKLSELVQIGKKLVRVFRVSVAAKRKHSAWISGYNSILNSPESARSFCAAFRPDMAEASDAKVAGWIKVHFQLEKVEVMGLTIWDGRSDTRRVPVEITAAHPDYTRLEDMADAVEPEEDYSEGW